MAETEHKRLKMQVINIKMTIKQQKFKEGMVQKITGLSKKSNTQIAIDAGYSVKTAYSIANENLNKPEIKEAIDSRIAEIEAKTEITVEFIRQEHLRLSQLAEAKGDLTNATANIRDLGRHLAMYSDNLNTADLDKRREMDEVEQAECKRIASIMLREDIFKDRCDISSKTG